MRFSLERCSIDDASRLLDLSRSIGWPHSLGDWQTNLGAGLVYGHRDEAGRFVSSTVLHEYQGLEGTGGIASLGMVIVRTEARRTGLARALVERALENTSLPTMLVATPDGEPLYRSLDFQEAGLVQNLVAPSGVRLPVENHQTIRDTDLGKVLGFDRRAFGADRSKLLQIRWKQAAGGSLLPGRDLFDWPKGFGWKIPQGERLLLGPVIAPDTQGALQIVGNLAAGHTGPVRVDVPGEHQEFIQQLVDAGFQKQALRVLMLRGAESLPGDRRRMFAVAALAFG